MKPAAVVAQPAPDKKVDNEKCLALHKRLLADDPTASEELAGIIWEPLLRTLRKKNSRLAWSDALSDGATDAFMSYVGRPAQYDPDKSSLLTYLVNSATGDIRNALDKGRRHRRRYTPAGCARKVGEMADRQERRRAGWRTPKGTELNEAREKKNE